MARKNSALASKRVSGQSANTIMNINLKLTRCDHVDIIDEERIRCTGFPIRVENLPGGKTRKLCIEHVPTRNVTTIVREFNVNKFLKSLGWS